MQILFYSGENEGSTRLSRFIEVLVPKDKITYVYTHEALLLRLRHPVNNIAASVFFISSRDDLQRIMELRDLLWEMRILIILPDKEPETITMAHSLHPRFIGYADDDFLDIASVLGRIVGKSYRVAEMI